MHELLHGSSLGRCRGSAVRWKERAAAAKPSGAGRDPRAGGRVRPTTGVRSPRRGAAEGPAIASGQRGGPWAGSGGAHIRSSRRTTPGRATRGWSTACAAAPRLPSRGCTSGTPPASTTSRCAWSGTGRTRRTSPRTCSSARSSACRSDREVLLRPWLYRLTLNRCYDYLRGSARRPLPVATGADAPSPQDPYEQSELQRLLEAAIGDLTRRQRAALLLKDVHGLSLVEVAACLDLTPGSVEVLLARARRAFRARFEERCARRRPAVAALLRRPRGAAAAAAAGGSGRAGASAAVRRAGARAAGRRAVPAAHGGGRERHRRRARPAGVGQDGRADRRRGGDDGHGRDRRHAGRPSSAARRPPALAAVAAQAPGRRRPRRPERESEGAQRRPSPSLAPSPSPSPAADGPALAVADRRRGAGAAGEPTRDHDTVAGAVGHADAGRHPDGARHDASGHAVARPVAEPVARPAAPSPSPRRRPRRLTPPAPRPTLARGVADVAPRRLDADGPTLVILLRG